MLISIVGLCILIHTIFNFFHVTSQVLEIENFLRIRARFVQDLCKIRAKLLCKCLVWCCVYMIGVISFGGWCLVVLVTAQFAQFAHSLFCDFLFVCCSGNT